VFQAAFFLAPLFTSTIMDAATVEYFEGLTARQHLCRLAVRHTGDAARGKGVFAVDSISQGTAVLCEEPIVVIQESENRGWCFGCGHCLRFIGGVSDQLQLLTQLPIDPSLLPFHQQIMQQRIAPVQCLYGCDVSYCSEACRDAAIYKGHGFLCTGPDHAPTAAAAFADFCRSSNDLLMLVAMMYARAAADITRGVDVVTALRPFSSFQSADWWQVANGNSSGESQAELVQDLKDLTASAVQLLHETGIAKVAAVASFLTVPVFSRLAGAVELNCLGINLRSPMSDYLLAVEAAGPSIPPHQKEALQVLLDAIPQDEPDPPLKGFGLYALQGSMNHSCAPALTLREQACDFSATITLVANTAISAGQELTVNYLEEGLPLQERRLGLQEYGFMCSCSLCNSGV
jgi:hypothetical protein